MLINHLITSHRVGRGTMKGILTFVFVVAAAFAFSLLMIAGAVGGKVGLPTAVATLCAWLTWPGMAITEYWLHIPLLGNSNFFPLTLFFNTVIYSVVFGLPHFVAHRLSKAD